MRQKTTTRIFLSSTYTDLAAARLVISQWLTGIFGADLTIMETFGSDALPPEVNSVRRVRDSDLFVGIYAHRYGTIDKMTNESIVELELDEARRAFSAGTLNDILLYIVDETAPWPEQDRETSQIAKTGLVRLKEKARQHTVTFFKSRDDLLFSITRDIYRRLSDRIVDFPFKARASLIPSPKPIRQPVGMEFLTSENRGYLIGRDSEIQALIARFDDDSIVLVLGDSGVGKTSLIHAGLIPTLADMGRRTVYTRPLGYPCSDIIRQIQTTAFETRPAHKGSLVSLLAEASAAFAPARTVLIIDQFEDILAAHESRETADLISELRAVRDLGSTSVRVLISYRSDLEGRLGEYWQAISGSPRGLPRVYVNGIKDDEAWKGVKQAAQDLSVVMKLRDYEEKRIKNDLLTSGRSLGLPDVYPPHVQMLIDHIWSASKQTGGEYTFLQYQESGGMEGVIGGYLNRQLEYAQDSEGSARLVLVSLVRSFGVKAQRPIDQIIADTGLDRPRCELALERLIDLRLVRHVDEYYEISHDFIAKRIISTLVDSEEREYKRFRELLTTKSAAYQTTRGTLTSEELLMLYKYRQRIVPTEEESHLLLASWIQGRGPALYWLLSSETAKLLDWLRAEESNPNITRDEKVSIVLLRKRLGESPIIDQDYLALRSYRLSAELADLILEDPSSIPDALITNGLRHRREEVRAACIEAVLAKIKNGDWHWIRRLQTSTSVSYHNAYQTLVLRNDTPVPPIEATTDRPIALFALLKRIATATTQSESTVHYASLEKMRPPSWILLFGRALARVRAGHVQSVLTEVRRASLGEASVLLAAIGSVMTQAEFDKVLSTYEKWTSSNKITYGSSALFAKVNAIADAVARSSSTEHLPRLRQSVLSIGLLSSSRGIVFALLKDGDQTDVKLVLDRIALQPERITWWNHAALARTLCTQMARSATGIPQFLKDIADKEEFWVYLSRDERPKRQKESLLPIISPDNRPLYVRLSAFAMIGTATKDDREYLLKLTTHAYGLIAGAAVQRMVYLFGDESLRDLTRRLDEEVKEGHAESRAHTLRFAETVLYNLVSSL